MLIECAEKCPYQEMGYCMKTICTCENGQFESFNLCPYASISMLENQPKEKDENKKEKTFANIYYY